MSEQALKWLGQHFTSILLVLSFIIQIAPIKINPWSSLVKWIGNALTIELATKLEQVETNLNSLNTSIDENEKDRIRWEILDFANSCRQGRKHSKDQFQHIITLNDKYKKLLEKTKDKNGVFDSEYQYIQSVYKERQEKNDFI